MDPKETPKERVARVASEMGPVIRRQAHGRWSQVRVAERNERGRHVWRFRTGGDAEECFLHIEHRAMVWGRKPAERLLKRLEAAGWLDRLHGGSETALLLSRDGELVSLHGG